jgi:hypothetical protein
MEAAWGHACMKRAAGNGQRAGGGQLSVGRCQRRVGCLIRPFSVRAISATRSSGAFLIRPRCSATASQCSVSCSSPRAISRERRFSALVQRPVASAMFAPTESTDRTSCSPTVARSKAGQRATERYTSAASATESLYTVRSRKLLAMPNKGHTAENSPLPTGNCPPPARCPLPAARQKEAQ